ncbi:MAG: hypothetical protein QM705_04335 [Ancrocorticia sp.]
MNNVEDLAQGPMDEEDLEILEALREMWDAVDPVPEGLTDRIQFAMSVASLQAEVARIVEEAEALAVVRSTYERAMSVTFETSSVTAMLDIDEVDTDTVDITGWVSVKRVEVELRERHRSRFTHTDSNGRFEFPGISRGLIHLVLRPSDPGSRPIITPAIEL